jgi:addiction module RelE/StbE family toxin
MAKQMSLVEMRLIQKAMMEKVSDFFPFFAAITKIRNLWNDKLEKPELMLTDLSEGIEQHMEGIPTASYYESIECDDLELDLEIAADKKINWLIGLSSEFKKSVKKVDKKLKGRILDAIETLSTDPVSPKGDTIKPLTKELAGLWRYRVGDFRLVYKPDSKNKQITLLTFSSRGSVYS